jgi:hypothetical protein
MEPSLQKVQEDNDCEEEGLRKLELLGLDEGVKLRGGRSTLRIVLFHYLT